MVQSKRLLALDAQEEAEHPKRQNSGELRPRSRRMSSEESAYTTDEASDEEEEITRVASSRKSCKAPRRWRPSEDRRLAESVKQHGEANWKAIAARVGSRNHVQCLQRWKKVLRPGLVKGQWSPEEDAVLMKLASSGFKNWGVLSNHMPGRTSKQCRERWCHHLDPSINKGAYTPREDKIIIETQAKIGNKWSQIAARLPGRTENSIKIRCKALQRRGSSAQSTMASSRNSAAKRNPSAATSRSRVMDEVKKDVVNEMPERTFSAPLESLSALPLNEFPSSGKLQRSTSSPPTCSPKPVQVEIPVNQGRPAMCHQTPFGRVPSPMTPDSFVPLLSPVPPPPVMTEYERYEDRWRSCPRATTTVAPPMNNHLPDSGQLWSTTFTPTIPTVNNERFVEHAPYSGSFMDCSNVPAQESGTASAATSMPIFWRNLGCNGADSSLSDLFTLGANAIIGHSGGNPGRGQACHPVLRMGEETLGSTAVAGSAPGSTIKAEEDDLKELGDLSTSDVRDLQAAVGGDDDEVAPLRSCCSFLDIPGDGAVVGDMPLSW